MITFGTNEVLYPKNNFCNLEKCSLAKELNYRLKDELDKVMETILVKKLCLV